MNSKSKALSIIRSEHRSLAAVINSMDAMMTEIKRGKIEPNFQLLWSMIYYIDVFPDRLHHPKENDWLFARTRLRTHEADALIDDLISQHDREDRALVGLRKTLGNYEANVSGSLEPLVDAVHGYAEFSAKHVRLEEYELFPIAERHLLPEDWDDIAAAFSENEDPLADQHSSDQFFLLFREIVANTPAPIGLGTY